ncbi:hypothetical protein MWU75_10060 [Ornithinimicrobium sp. F0845]|uniref:hypothetical protein n=1 Tax=Ornithinimicrobium sp. F0845 TaxID=2926412 RepID=UPI001FF6819D|nr:hypothetical protein [Ornithinimicrobium sp. F0845]MCK0112481.1 hypothetical protein [Ornithinimicrobium sp. F0845]
MRKVHALFVTGALSLSLAACGGGGGDDGEAADAIAQSMMESSDDTFVVDQGQADCVGEGLVDKIGVDQLKEYGMLTDDLAVNESVDSVVMEEAHADSAAEVIVGCIDAAEMMREQMAVDDSMTEEQLDCVGEVLDEDTLTRMFSLIFQGKEDEFGNELMEPLMACMMGE